MKNNEDFGYSAHKDFKQGTKPSSPSSLQSDAVREILEEIEGQIAYAEEQIELYSDRIDSRQRYLEQTGIRLEGLIEDKEEPKELIQEAKSALAEARKLLKELHIMELE